MFERYVQKSRRVIFFARYESQQCGATKIETEHMLLALLREDPQLMGAFLSSETSASIRPEIERRKPPLAKLPKTAQLPLSIENKRALAYAGREADRLQFQYIAPVHLLFGLLCEDQSLAATLLKERGVEIERVRLALEATPAEQRLWPANETRGVFKPRLAQRVLHLILAAFIFLLVVQVFVKTLTHELFRFDATFYAIALPALLAMFASFTLFLRSRGALTYKETLSYLIVASAALGIAFVPIFHTLRSR